MILVIGKMWWCVLVESGWFGVLGSLWFDLWLLGVKWFVDLMLCCWGVVGLLEIGLISVSLVVGWLVMLCCWFHYLVIGV